MNPLLAVENLCISFAGQQAVDAVSFELNAGECLALVGESGSGKSVTARSLLGLSGGTVSAEKLMVCHENALALSEPAWQKIRGNSVVMILQDALMALDPLRPVGREIEDVLKEHGTLNSKARRAKVIEALASVDLPDPERRMKQRSTQLSGGMRQRVLIA
ncbi:MAG TPA: ABC transporter ATP-binding protein, partial [Micrococcaceae bacterium]|nr:ABC transporter ATP-binding protein [Micrococcaceae bacterium]